MLWKSNGLSKKRLCQMGNIEVSKTDAYKYL
jgi:hypothetical protein